MKHVTLVPTSHVAEESLAAVRKAIEEKDPDCVAVELDMNRYYAMKSQESISSSEMIKAFGMMNFLVYWLMKRLQKSLGDKVGVIPGSEMVRAVDMAAGRGIKIAFIDRDIGVTFARMSRIPRLEKLRMIWLMLKGSFGLLFSKIYKGKYTLDLTKAPPEDLVKEAMGMLKKELPGVYRVLLEERDAHMASKIKGLVAEFDRIVVVVGAGHREGITKRLTPKAPLPV